MPIDTLAPIEQTWGEAPKLGSAFVAEAPWPMATVAGAMHQFTACNEAFCRLVGKENRRLLGKPFREAMPENLPWLSRLDQVYRTGDADNFAEASGPEINFRSWSLAFWPMQVEGKSQGVVIQITEIPKIDTQMLAVNEALLISSVRQHEIAEAAVDTGVRLQFLISAREEVAKELAEQARLLDLSNDAIIVRNLTSKITFWNKGAEAFYGWKREEVLGKNLHELLQTTFPAPVEDILEILHRDGHFTGEVVQIARDGRRVPSLCRWALDREAGSILTSYTDITARKAAELEMSHVRDTAIAASQAKDSFLAALSHELRTPLNPVLLIASDGVSDPTLPAEVRNSFGIIVKHVLQEARLIDDLLDLTKINHGKMPLELSPTEINAPLRDAVATVESEFKEKNILLIMSLETTSCVVSGDSGRLQQVFCNLLKNALKFTPSGGKVTVATRRSDDRSEIEITIRDTGLGITADELKRLFIAFSQGDHGAAGSGYSFGGLGLGLAISRMIVRLHSGRLVASSAGRGLGSTFEIALPLVRAETESSKTLPTPVTNSNRSGSVFFPTPEKRRILLVEDHDATRISLQRLLVRRGHFVVPAATMAEAFLAAQSQQFDVAISDIGLPDGDGCELMIALRDKYGLKGIALTGYGMDKDFARGERAGFDAYLTKPISMQSLEIAMAKVE